MINNIEYDVAETFFSLKGEGRWTGTPMYFIRLAGCNLNCKFCDTKYAMGNGHKRSLTTLLEEVDSLPYVDRVVLTGGEPTLQEIDILCHYLRDHGYTVHIETNGTRQVPVEVDWITVSPKSTPEMLEMETLARADEVKFLVGKLDDELEEALASSGYVGPAWEQYIDMVMNWMGPIQGELIVMPIADTNSRVMDSLIWENITAAVDYCLKHPQFSLTMQMHKILNIR